MARRSSIALVLAAVAVWAASLDATAAPLPLTSTARLVLTVGVVASVGSNPIPPVYLGHPVSTADAGGSLSLVPQGDQFDLSFTFSIFSDANPLVLMGSYGSGAVPVTLRIDEISYQSPASGQLPARVSVGDLLLLGSVTGTARGSLTIGSSIVPFTLSTDQGWYGDGTPAPYLSGRVGLDRVALGDDVTGGGVFSGFGAFSDPNVTTVDGVTFGVLVRPEFYTLVYAPEPGSLALLVFAAVPLLWLRSRVA
jgi:hypothetical protein